MIIDYTKQSLPDDAIPAEAPPSYDTVAESSFHVQDAKTPPRPVQHPINSPPHIHTPLGPSSPVPTIIKSPSSSSAKGKGKASSNWFNFGASKTTREVHSTVLGLVRDLVREQQTNAKAASGILESCAEACSGYDLAVSDILQEKSIENHTPLYWAIVKRPPDGEDGDETSVPDLLTALISYASPLTPQTISDVRHACLLTSDQLLFQRLRMSPEFAPLSGTDEMLLGARIPPDEITVEDVPGEGGAFVVNFSIVHFQKRMQVSQRIDLEFIARARMWKLGFSIAQQSKPLGPRQGSWCISLALLENSPPTWIDSRLIIPDPSPTPTSPSPPTLPSSPSLLDRVRAGSNSGKPPIVLRLKSSQQLVAPLVSRRDHRQTTVIMVSLEDSAAATSLQYSGTPYILPDETLRARLEAGLGRSSEGECVIC